MLSRLLQRVLYTVPVIWLVVSLVFLLIHLVPGDPIAQMLGEGAPAADIAATRHAYGLDAPLGDQYIRYWKGVLHGDLGRSIRYNQTVTRLIATRYPYTLRLTLASLLIAILLSIPAGVRSARPPQSLGRPPALSRQPVRPVIPQLRAGPHPDLVFCHQTRMAPSLRRGLVCQPRSAGPHHGQRPRCHPHPHGAHFDARRTQSGLHPHRPRQGFARAHGRLPPRPAQRDDPRTNRARPAVRRAARRRHRHRKDFLLARHRPPHRRRYLESRLFSGARLHPGDRPDLRRCELSDGCAVFGG